MDLQNASTHFHAVPITDRRHTATRARGGPGRRKPMGEPYAIASNDEKSSENRFSVFEGFQAGDFFGAGDGTRTRDVQLGKLAFYH